jgi:carbamoyltransferase
MHILGLMGLPGTQCHDGSAALFKDGKIIAFAEQERFSRIKHAPGQGPIDAALFCLKYSGLSISDIDYVTYGWCEAEEDSPGSEVLSKWVVKSLNHIDELLPRSKFQRSDTAVFCVKHHIAHINAAYYGSGFTDAACVIIDGRGEYESITLAEISNNEIRVIKQYPPAYSLGLFYEAASEYCGLGYDVPGKFMGLSSYGKAYPLDSISFDSETGDYTVPTIQKGESISSLVDSEVCKRWLDFFERNCYPYRRGTKDSIMYYLDFVASIQKTLEKVILDILKHLRNLSKSNNLVFGGGVALNSALNRSIFRSGLFRNMFVHPASNDAGCSIGSILEFCRLNKIRIIPQNEYSLNTFLGPGFTDEDIDGCLDFESIENCVMDADHLAEKIANDLMENKIVGLFCNRAEMGPRVLGNRSMIANPCDRNNLYRVNEVKGRELWRPLAPSILDEYFENVFENDCSKNLCSYMLTTSMVKEKWRRIISAVVHIDGTSRPQIVGREHKNYYDLISKFYEKSGVPLVVNTSLNLKDEPIVNSPREALKLLLDGKIDKLVLNNHYVSRAEMLK